MPTGLSFLAIDFETASSTQRASACALGYAVVVSGAIEKSGQTLIDPDLAPGLWSGMNIGIHGITPSAVSGAPKFMEAWQGILAQAPGLPIVAHNASFDMSVLRHEHGRARAPVPGYQYACSARIALRAWPNIRSMALPNLAHMLGIELRHHDPGSDANACAQITINAARELGAKSLDSALAVAGLCWGQVFAPDFWVACGSLDSGSAGLRPADTTNVSPDPAHPFFGQTVVFTGRLETMSRGEAEGRIRALGGKVGSSVSKQTDFLVVGAEAGSKLAKAEKLGTRMLDEATFRALLEEGPGAVEGPSSAA